MTDYELYAAEVLLRQEAERERDEWKAAFHDLANPAPPTKSEPLDKLVAQITPENVHQSAWDEPHPVLAALQVKGKIRRDPESEL